MRTECIFWIHFYVTSADGMNLKYQICTSQLRIKKSTRTTYYHLCKYISEITKVCLTLPDIRSDRDSLITRPKKYQAFPAVVAFNQGLPIFHFSF